MLSGNIKNFLLGGTRNRELAETRETWESSQELWRASPFAHKDFSDFAIEITRESVRRAGRSPALPILVGVAEAVELLLKGESVGDISPIWQLIETDIEVAIEFRQVVTRRRRWAANYNEMHEAFAETILECINGFYNLLPESCFTTPDGTRESFEVPLIDLLDDPVAAVDRLFMLPYADQPLRLDVFHQLREISATNILIASGFRPDTNIYEVQHKLVRPESQRNKTGAEIAALYLRSTPFQTLLDIPVPFAIPDELRFEHCHIVGGTGHGKTQLMQKMIHADLVASQEDGRAVMVIDSQGDLIGKLIRLDLFAPDTPNSLADRLVIVDPADVEFPTALNLFDAHLERLEDYRAADRERVLNGVVELYEMFFGAFLGAELTQKQGVIFKYLARLMLAIPNATIYTLMEIMEDGKRFSSYMDLLDGSARYFFETEFFHPSFAATKKQVLRRLWGVLSTPAFERMFTQPKNKIDLFDALNTGKIVLVSTAKDLLKREGSQLLGRFFIAMLTQAALERSTIPEHRRNPVSVYVDEAQEYFDDSIETILNQARKYRVGITVAHQTLDQLSPRLRSSLFSNTSFKCVGGVSAKDARTLADELHTTPEFIEGMKRKGARSEFATWVKHLTGRAVRLSVELGFLERRSALTEEEYDQLLAKNRTRYCGTLAELASFKRITQQPPEEPRAPPIQEPGRAPEASKSHSEHLNEPAAPRAPEPRAARRPEHVATSPIPDQRELGKGGAKHRYLQSIVKELAEAQGLKATIEAPLRNRSGQVDVLIEREGVVAAVEISVSTPVDQERENLRKCLDEGFPKIAVVLAKSKVSQANYRIALAEMIGDGDRERVAFLTPEEIPDFIAGLAMPLATERTVRGYRVKGALVQTSPEEARARQGAIARLIAKSLADQR